MMTLHQIDVSFTPLKAIPLFAPCTSNTWVVTLPGRDKPISNIIAL